MPIRYDLILDFQSGQLQGQRAKMRGDHMMIGSATHCDLVLTDSGISGEHAVIRYVQNQYVIADMGSTNGVVVNGTKIVQPRVLYHGDVVGIGEVFIKIRVPGTKAKISRYDPQKLEIGAGLGVGEVVSQPGLTALFRNKRLRIYGAAGLLVLVVVWLMRGTEQDEGEPGKPTLETQQIPQVKREIAQKQQELAQLLIKEVEKDTPPTPEDADTKQKQEEREGVRLARERFHRGMGELRAMNYVQAEMEFNLALSINPKDILVAEYLLRARRKRRAVAMEHYELGKGYVATLRYELATYHFHKALEFLAIEEKNLDNESEGYRRVVISISDALGRMKKEE